MPRSSKAGPARSRRRPDPSTLFKTSEIMLPSTVGEQLGGGGAYTVKLPIVTDVVGTPVPNGQLFITGQTTGIIIRDFFGTEVSPVCTVVDNGTTLFCSVAGGLASGVGLLWIPSKDQTARGINGEWIAPALHTISVPV